jgi:hypothetical protein
MYRFVRTYVCVCVSRYCVRFFKDDAPVHVEVDDRVPCDVTARRPLFACSDRAGEVWCVGRRVTE